MRGHSSCSCIPAPCRPSSESLAETWGLQIGKLGERSHVQMNFTIRPTASSCVCSHSFNFQKNLTFSSGLISPGPGPLLYTQCWLMVDTPGCKILLDSLKCAVRSSSNHQLVILRDKQSCWQYSPPHRNGSLPVFLLFLPELAIFLLLHAAQILIIH